MHKKIFATAVCAAFLIAMVPAVDASVTKSATYDVPSGPARVTQLPDGRSAGPGLSTRFGAEEWDEGVFSDSGDELLFGDADDNPDDQVNGLIFQTLRDAKGSDSVLNVGVFGSALEAEEDLYTEFVFNINDDNFDSTYFSFCIFTGDDNICETGEQVDGEPEDLRADGCGSTQLTSPVPAGGPENGLSAFVYASHLNADTLETCFGSSGSATLVMS